MHQSSKANTHLQLHQFVILLTILERVNGQTTTRWATPITTSVDTNTTPTEASGPADSRLEKLSRITLGRRNCNKDLETNTTVNKSTTVTVPGQAGLDYPTYNSIPVTSFNCSGRMPVRNNTADEVDIYKGLFAGYYADVESRCQVFHVCYSAKRSTKQSFLCPNGTIFNQPLRICEWWTKVNCENYAASGPSGKSESDMMSEQTVTTQVKIVYPSNQRHNDANKRHNNSRIRNVSVGNNVDKLLLDNMFTNFSDNKIAHYPFNREKPLRSDTSRKKVINRGTTTYSSSNSESSRKKLNTTLPNRLTNSQQVTNKYNNVDSLLPIFSDKLAMIDKLIYSTNEKTNDMKSQLAVTASAQHLVTYSPDVEIIPSVTEYVMDEESPMDKVVSKHSTQVSDIRNLNEEFVKFKRLSNGFYDRENNTTANNFTVHQTDDNLKNKLNLTQYGIYYLVNGTEQKRYPENKTNNLQSNIIFQLGTLSERLQKDYNNNYNEYVKVRQNTVMPSIPKVSDILTGLHHLNYDAINPSKEITVIGKNNSVKMTIGRSVNYKNFTQNTGFTNKTKTNVLNSTAPTNPNTDKFGRYFVQLKELDRNKVKVNGVQQVEQQVQITQRPVYRFNMGTHPNTKNHKEKTRNVNVGVSGNNNLKQHTLGSTALYGIDLLASTSVINNNKNQVSNVNMNQNHKPALSMYDIQTINQLQGGTNFKKLPFQQQVRPQPKYNFINGMRQSGRTMDQRNRQVGRFIGGQEPRNMSQSYRPYAQFHPNRKQDSVVVLPALGFSLNSADEIRAFNNALSAGLLGDNR